jgi:uncharacterized membrane protein
MKLLKLIDVILQTIIIAGSILSAIITGNIFVLILIYIGLGIYQPLSFIIQLFTLSELSPQRKNYAIGVLLFFSIWGLLSLVSNINSSFTIAFITIAAGTLAIYYLHISYAETFEDKR